MGNSERQLCPKCKKLKNLDALVSDVQWFEKTRKKRGTTWGEGKIKVQKRHVQNTMGYVVL
jgi:hypothetical protein